jgi:hypothetical protein
VLDNDLARMIKHAVRGVPVNDETMGLGDIHAVGSFGDFLSLDSTLRHMREDSRNRARPSRRHGPRPCSGSRSYHHTAGSVPR